MRRWQQLVAYFRSYDHDVLVCWIWTFIMVGGATVYLYWVWSSELRRLRTLDSVQDVVRLSAARGSDGKWMTVEQLKEKHGEHARPPMPYCDLDVRGKGKWCLPAEYDLVVEVYDDFHNYMYSQWRGPNGDCITGDWYEMNRKMRPAREENE